MTTAESTIEAMLFTLRGGLSCLAEAANRDRLRSCDAAAIERIAIRLRTWRGRNVPWLPAYTDDDIAKLLKVWRSLKEREAA